LAFSQESRVNLNMAQRFQTISLESPIAGVKNEAWDRFVRTLEIQAVDAVSHSGGYGSFDLRPRRLAEIGVMRNLSTKRFGKRQIQIGDFVPPFNEIEFLRNPMIQYRVLVMSMRSYLSGKIDLAPGMSLSGALAILHVGGRGALATWPKGALSFTEALFKRANGLF
jgi:hypothetical protein